jgi:ornithine carbamoyltransferase
MKISDEVLTRMVQGTTLHDDYHPQQQMAEELLKLREEKGRGEETVAEVICSFCGKNHTQVALMIASDEANICNECVRTCMGVVFDKLEREEKEKKV